jgi:hypothetical protein
MPDRQSAIGRPLPRLAATLALPVLLLLLGPVRARADHLTIALTVEGTKSQAHADTDRWPPAEGTRPRPVVRLHTGDTLHVRWFVKNVDRTPVNRMIVHFFIAQEAQAGQKEVPDPQKGALAENAFAIELAPGASTRGTLHLPINTPGVYLARVESRFTERGHEHFAAVDVQVE